MRFATTLYRTNRFFMQRVRYSSTAIERKGIVIGVCCVKKGEDDKDGEIKSVTDYGSNLSENLELSKVLSRTNFKGKEGQTITIHTPVNNVAVSGILNEIKTSNELNDYNDDGVDQKKNSIRKATSLGVTKLKSDGCNLIEVDLMNDAFAAAEGAILATYSYDELKTIDKQNKTKITITPSPGLSEIESEEWKNGAWVAEAQNLARTLMDTPANLMTPTIFCERAQKELAGHNNTIKINIYEEDWIEDQEMNAFYSVGKGSSEPSKFLEIEYCSDIEYQNKEPLVFVGKGVTFDSGGISIKPSAGMAEMKADMGGAACTLATMKGIADCGIEGRVIALIPLCENMPSGDANKPGDVVTTKNGMTVEIDNTDAEGRLILCDTLTYAESKYSNASAVISIATLTGAMVIALGSGATGAFVTSKKLWEKLESSGHASGERFWRMPLFQHYHGQINSKVADIKNVGGREAGSSTAAVFLQKFVKNKNYAHLDIAGVMSKSSSKNAACSYLPTGGGMTGRPVRALIDLSRKFV